jgi:hypothetical protein
VPGFAADGNIVQGNSDRSSKAPGGMTRRILDIVQGYFLSGPLDPDLVATWMHGHVTGRVKVSAAGLRRVV